MHKVIVYGTLRPGIPERTVRFNGKMYNLGWFPGVQLGGTDEVIGEVVEVDDERLAAFDHYEGYYQDNPNSLYMRRTIVLNGEPHFVYEYNCEDFDELSDRRILDGDWLNLTEEQSGSNAHLTGVV